MNPYNWQYNATQATCQQTSFYQHCLRGDAISTNEGGCGVDALGSAANSFGIGNVPNQFDNGVAPNSLIGADYVFDVAHDDRKREVTRRISRAEWDRYKEVIVQNYPEKTLPALQKFMSKNHGFDASVQQWKKKLREWNLGKNLPTQVTRFVGKRAQSRLQQTRKKTNFTLRGHQIPIDKVERHMQSYVGPSNSLTGTTPDGLTYQTYGSPALPSIHPRTPVQEQDLQPDTLPGPAPSASPYTLPVQQNAEIGSTQVQMALWHGQDLDDLLRDCRTACQVATNGNYMDAKPIFMNCLDGLEVLLNPTHATFLAVLEQYVSFAVSNQDFDEATDRVHKCYNKHKERLGSHDKRVSQCLARLGRLYLSRGLTSHAFHMLVNARQGLQSATLGNPEDAYNCVHGTVKAIIAIHMKHGEFDEAERELLGLITQTDNLGECYQDDSRSHKHDLVHLYHNNLLDSKKSYKHTAPNRNQMERLLLELINFKSMSTEMTRVQMCCWDKLRSFYEITGQPQKLERILPEMEQVYTRANFVGPTDGSLPTFKYNMINSFQSLLQYEKAEWWLLRMQDEAEAHGFEGVSIRMRLANVYFLQEKVDDAVQMMKEAQTLGKECLDDNHTFHSVISESISRKTMTQGCCPDCYVNSPGTETGGGPEIHKFLTSEADVDLPGAEAVDEVGMEREESNGGEDADEGMGAQDLEGCEDGDVDGERGLAYSSIVSIIDRED